MKRSDAEKRATALRRELERHNRLYYVEAKPEIGDREYDALYRELQDIEAQFPDLLTPDSPTLRVGGEPLSAFAQVKHAVPLMSLDNTYSPDEVREFGARLRRLAEGQPFSFVLEPKIDGVAVALRYEDGLLTQGATRGDGVTGDDITANIRTIRAIPLRLNSPRPPRVLEVRGEVYMDREGFARLNRSQEEAGLQPFANPRNATAGTLKQLDPRVVAGRPLAALFYAAGTLDGLELPTHEELIRRFAAFGLPTVPRHWVCRDIDAVLAALDELREARGSFPFQIDGGVVKVNERELYARFGVTAKSPRWAVAYKYEPEQAETVLRDITVQVGRTGVLTPVAELEPVFLAGTTIRRATLHNEDEVRRKDIRVGDRVIIEKAGDVIPAVVRSLTAKRTGAEKPFRMPAQCPACGGAVARRDGEVAVRCENLQCPKQGERLLNHLASRAALDIEGLGGIVAEKLVERGLVTDALDLFALEVQPLAALNLGTEKERRVFGPKNAAKLLASVERARLLPLDRWLHAIGIPDVGKTTAHQLALAHAGLADLSGSRLLKGILEAEDLDAKARELGRPAKGDAAAKEVREGLRRRAEELRAAARGAGLTREVGPVVARSVLDFFASERGLLVLKRLRELGIDPQPQISASATAEGPLAGRTFVLTGTLAAMGRDEAGEEIRRRGGQLTESVSRHTSFLVVGDNPGASKTSKARELGVPVLDEKAFLSLLGGAAPAPPARKAAPPRQGELFQVEKG